MNTLTLDLPPEISPNEARLLLAITLFREGKLSLGRAAELSGYSDEWVYQEDDEC